MTSIRRLLGLFATIALVVFAVPIFAAQPSKIFGLTMDTVPSGNFVAGQVNTFTATYTNLTPTGNSVINWVHLTVPKSLWGPNPSAPPATPTISFPQGGTLYSINTTADPIEIVVNNIPGIATGGGTWRFQVSVYVPSAPACGNYKFTATAFTGNSGTQGQPFAYQATYAGPPLFTSKDSIAVVSGCSLKFDTQPTSATAGTTITGTPYNPSGAPVKVGVYDGASSLVTGFTGPVSIAITPNTGTAGAVLSGGGSVNAVAGVATFPSLSINTAGQDYQLRAGIGGPTVDSSKFWITGVAGVVDCTDGTNYAKSPHGNVDPKLTYVDFDTSDPGDWGVRRGPNSHDGTNNNCQKVGVSVTVNGAVVEFLYDKSIPNQVANFKYWIIWPETTPNPDGTSETSSDGASSFSTARFGEKRPLVSWIKDTGGNPVYVPVLNCSSDDLNQTSALLMPKAPTKEPFITLGATYADYAPDAEAKVCLAEHIMIGSGTDVAGNFQVIYADKIVDRVDTFVRQP